MAVAGRRGRRHLARPGRRRRSLPSTRPYTLAGRQVDVHQDGPRGGWVEVLECGLAHPDLLAAAGLPGASGPAMGIGLDRMLMLRKGLDDIRLLRSADPRGRRAAPGPGALPAGLGDAGRPAHLSVAVATEVDEEALGDRVRLALGDEAADGTLTAAGANRLRDRVRAAVREGG